MTEATGSNGAQASVWTLSDEAKDACLPVLRTLDRDLYLSTLLLPSAVQPLGALLFGIHGELHRCVLMPGDVMARQIRLQWWVEVFDGTRREEGKGHPLAHAALSAIDADLVSPKVLADKAAAHQLELYADPFENRDALEGWAGETRSVLFQTLANAAGPSQTSSDTAQGLSAVFGHAGVACALVSLLQTFAVRLRNGSVAFPGDLLTAVGLDAESAMEIAQTSQGREKLAPPIGGLLDLALEHERKARDAFDALPDAERRRIAPLVRPLVLVVPTVARLRKRPDAVWQGDAAVPQWRSQWLLWRGVR
ncbi:MAG: squalene/phytoene synthase family protein [Pseudomonadota bacterium]